MCFDMTMDDKKNVKLNCCVRSRRAAKCVSAAGLRMRSKNPVDEEEASAKRGLRATTARSKALRSSKKATVRKQQKRRQVMMCLVEVENVAFTRHHQEDFTRFTHSPPRVPSAMAPANTTQYLMADVADDQFDDQFNFQPGSTTTTASLSPAEEL